MGKEKEIEETMDKILNLIIMLFLHFFADYQLQGILASMKQRSWWKEQGLSPAKYGRDYKAALLAHSFEWAFTIQLPVLYDIYWKCWGWEKFCILAVSVYTGLLLLNTLVHYVVDNAKANKHTINLITDQRLHFAQVAVTWLVYVLVIADYWK